MTRNRLTHKRVVLLTIVFLLALWEGFMLSGALTQRTTTPDVKSGVVTTYHNVHQPLQGF